LALPTQYPDVLGDIQAQVNRLLPPGFVTATGTAHLADLTRYLTATRRRLEQLPNAPKTDRDRMARVHAVRDAYDELLRALPAVRKTSPDVVEIGWQIEELRVSLWAQQLGTPRPVSEQRIYRAIDEAAQNG
jgi:ATP-dependent helicase HrpA